MSHSGRRTALKTTAFEVAVGAAISWEMDNLSKTPDESATTANNVTSDLVSCQFGFYNAIGGETVF